MFASILATFVNLTEKLNSPCTYGSTKPMDSAQHFIQLATVW